MIAVSVSLIAKGTSIGLARSQVPRTNRVKVPPGLIGKPTETEIYIDGSQTSALLDTGSTVSTVSENYYREHISSISAHKTNSIVVFLEFSFSK
jgi:hypothetical protein